MKYPFLITLLGFIFFTYFAKQGKETSNPNTLANPSDINLNNKITGNKMKIKIGSNAFAVGSGSVTITFELE